MPKLSYSLEDYMEVIYIQVQKTGNAKVTDISNIMNVKKSSVTGALNILAKENYVNYIPYSPITLTAKGEQLAKEIHKKHNLMAEFFIKTLNIEENEAKDIACELEHIISDDFIEKVKLFLSK